MNLKKRGEDFVSDIIELSTSTHLKDKLRSVDVFKETVLQHPFPQIVNVTVLTIVSLFSHIESNNTIRYAIYKAFYEINKSSKHSKDHILSTTNIMSGDEVIRRMILVAESNDPTARALTFLTLGELKLILTDISFVHHLMLNGLESHADFELSASIHVIGKTSQSLKDQPEQAHALLERILHMVDGRNHVSLDTKLQLISLLKYTGRYHSEYAIRSYQYCASLLPIYPTKKCVKVLLTVMTSLTKFNLYDLFTMCTKTLIGFIVHDLRSDIKVLALSQLSLLIKAPGAMEGYGDQLQWFKDLSIYFKELIEQSLGFDSEDSTGRKTSVCELFENIANKILDVFLVISKYSPQLILQSIDQAPSVYDMCLGLSRNPRHIMISDTCSEIICNAVIYQLVEATSGDSIDSIERTVDHIGHVILLFSMLLLQKRTKDVAHFDKTVLKRILMIYRALDMVIKDHPSLSDSIVHKILGYKKRCVDTLLSKMCYAIGGLIKYDEAQEVAHHFSKYYGVYHLPPESIHLLIQKFITPLREKVRGWPKNPDDPLIKHVFLISSISVVLKALKNIPENQAYKSQASECIMSTLWTLIDLGLHWNAYLVARESLCWGWTHVLYHNDENLFEYLKRRLTFDQQRFGDWLSLHSNICHLYRSCSNASNILHEVATLTSTLHIPQAPVFRVDFMTALKLWNGCRVDMLSLLETWTQILNVVNPRTKSIYRDLTDGLEPIESQTIQIKQRLVRLEQIFHDLSLYSLDMDDESIERVLSLSLWCRVLGIACDELVLLGSEVRHVKLFDMNRTHFNSIQSQLSLLERDRYYFESDVNDVEVLFEFWPLMKLLTFKLLLLIRNITLSNKDEAQFLTFDEIIDHFQSLKYVLNQYLDTPCEIPPYFYLTQHRHSVDFKISPYPGQPSESLVVRDGRYPATLMLNFNGIIASRHKDRNIQCIIIQAEGVPFDSPENFRDQEFLPPKVMGTTSITFEEKSSFTGLCPIKFPQPGFYKLVLTSTLLDDEDRQWKGPSDSFHVRVV